jgi:hypothetical protein
MQALQIPAHRGEYIEIDRSGRQAECLGSRGVTVQSNIRLAAADTVHRQKFPIPMKPWPQ